MEVWLPRILVALHRVLILFALFYLLVGALFSFWTALFLSLGFYLVGLAALLVAYLLSWWVLGAFSTSNRRLRLVSFPARANRLPTS